MEQLSTEEKFRQMSNKYSSSNYKKTQKNIWAKRDLQGWRNKLVNLTGSFDNKFVVDLGGGNGDKLLRFRELISKNSECILVDFADQPEVVQKLLNKNEIRYVKSDALEFLRLDRPRKFDLVFLFGFLHEINNFDEFFYLLAKNIDQNTTVLLSDNNLYYQGRHLSDKLNVITKEYVIYESKSFFKFIHLLNRIAGSGSKYLLVFHWGRVDKIISCISSAANRKKFTKHIRSLI